MTIKSIYVVARNPRLSPAEFLERWRAHARLAASFPSLLERFDGVVQCAVVPDGSSSRFDGANLLTMASLEAAAGVPEDPATETMRVDELEVFDGYVLDTLVTTREEVLIEGPETSTIYLEFVERPADHDRASFAAAWRADQLDELEGIPGSRAALSRVVHDHVVLPTPPGLECAGVAELWFDDASTAAEFLERRAARDLRAPRAWQTTHPRISLLCEVSQRWQRTSSA